MKVGFQTIEKFFAVVALGLGLACGGGGSKSAAPAPPSATITSFSANAAKAFAGQKVSFTGVFTGTGVLNPGNVPCQSGVPVALAMTQSQETFTLSASVNGGAATTATVTVKVDPLPALGVQPVKATVTNGGVIGLLVAIPDGATLALQGLSGTFKNGDAVEVPAESTGTLQTIQGTVDLGLGLTVPVATNVALVPAPSIENLVALPPTVAAGEAVQLIPTFLNGTAGLDQGIGGVVSGVAVASGPITATTTFTLTVVNAAGDSVSAKVIVQVMAATTIQGFSASTTRPRSGDPITLTPVFSGGTATIDQGIGPVVSGQSYVSAPLTAPTTFTLSVKDSNGGTTTAKVVVEPQAVVLSGLPQATSVLSVGGTQHFQVTVTGAATQAVTWFVDDLENGNATVGTVTADGVYQAPTVPGAHVLKVVSPFGGSATVRVEVIRLPLIRSFTVS